VSDESSTFAAIRGAVTKLWAVDAELQSRTVEKSSASANRHKGNAFTERMIFFLDSSFGYKPTKTKTVPIEKRRIEIPSGAQTLA
jgi:hypothetical protein